MLKNLRKNSSILQQTFTDKKKLKICIFNSFFNYDSNYKFLQKLKWKQFFYILENFCD